MDRMSNAKISMKLLVDKSKNKVLFAEAGKECVDFLFHMLSLPLGTVVGYLTKALRTHAPNHGSVGSLYGSLEALGIDVQEGLNKDCLLNPKPAVGSSSNVPLLTSKPGSDYLGSYKFYTCNRIAYDHNYRCNRTNTHKYVSDCEGTKCPECLVPMNHELKYVAPPPGAITQTKEPSTGGGYLKGVVTYMIMDDLSVQAMSPSSSFNYLNKFNVKDVGSLEKTEVSLDINLGVALMKAALMKGFLKSNTILTYVFLGKNV